jgi:hypothetical protein
MAKELSNKRFLTKSRFKIGSECPTKLFYTKKDEYQDNKGSDDFLAALAEGGFQVGEYAKCLFPGGHDIKDIDYETSLSKTNELLERDKVIIYEPAFMFGNLFVRVDVLVKDGDNIKLYEVKSKSCVGGGEDQFFTKNKKEILGGWRPYLEDIAFQHYVVCSAHPEWDVIPHLMLVNKNATAPSDGLHQKFLIKKDSNDRSCVEVIESITEEESNCELLLPIALDKAIIYIREKCTFGHCGMGLTDWIHFLEKIYVSDQREWACLSTVCGKCEFKASRQQRETGKRSGFHDCWLNRGKLQVDDLDAPTVLDIWKGAAAQMKKGRFLMTDVPLDECHYSTASKGGFSSKERKAAQIGKSNSGDATRALKPSLKAEIDRWEFPYNLIDFETFAPAIPMYEGTKPYAMVAFQFSHHLLYEDGRVEHIAEYIHDVRGEFPSYKFIEKLMVSLEKNNGTVFRYHNHENTVLRTIRSQIMKHPGDVDNPDKIIAFIDSITKPTRSEPETCSTGERNMVDLHAIVTNYYYDPKMKGSISIKDVLPAVINTSNFVKNKYGKPLGDIEVSSIHFSDEHTWIKEENGIVVSPYKRLDEEPVEFEHENDSELLFTGKSVSNGGDAMTAYARMQYTKMNGEERSRLKKSLLKYCELDTLAMVMIVEALRDWLGYND